MTTGKLPAAIEARVRELYEDVVDDRAEALEQLIREHPAFAEAIRRRVERAEAVWRGLADEPEPRPERIGPYRILDVLGEGGMGTVYLAEQKEPVHRRVALKVVKLGMDTRQVLRRFATERQALALMSHDNIAKVLDAGTTERGQPYFALEHVQGTPITAYCDRQRLTTTQRLRLLQQVCEGVQHAHQRGIIHRDLKPSNILVTEHQGRPVPKIIDFGIAKATNQRLIEATLYTERGQMIGTPEYMSPEQAEGTGADVDTRTDVYSLGVILYELLVGELPFSSDALRRAGLHEIQRMIREDEPRKLSTRLSTLGDASREKAEKRGTTPSALRRALHGDLDWIVLQALAKDRNRRYLTPIALSEDIERHLSDEPVVASPPSAAYRMRKFVRRYRGQVIAAAAVLVVLVGGVIAAVIRAEENARHERAMAEEVERRDRATALAHYRSARLAAQRGQWELALARYGEARTAGYEHPIELAIGEIEAFEGSQEPRRAAAALAALKRNHELGSYRATVLLLEADLAVDRRANPTAKLDLAERAVAIGGLAPADAAYAEALLATDPLAAIGHLERALALDPYHRRASDSYAIALLCTGRLEEAVRFGQALRLRYPDDPAVLIYAAFVAALAGESDRAGDLAADVRRRFGPDQGDVARFILQVASLIRWFNAAQMRSLVDTETSQLSVAVQNLAALVFKLGPLLSGLRNRENDEVPQEPRDPFLRLAPSIVRAYAPLVKDFPRNLLRLDRVLADLEAEGERVLDGGLHFAHGMLLTAQSRFAESALAFERAADTPSIIVEPKLAVFYLLNARALTLRSLEDADARAAERKRCADVLARAYGFRDLGPLELRLLFRYATELLGDREFAADIASRWSRENPDDAEAQAAREQALRALFGEGRAADAAHGKGGGSGSDDRGRAP